MALSAMRKQTFVGPTGRTISVPMAASTTIYQGGGVMLNSSGLAIPAADTASCRTLGVAMESKTSDASTTSYISVCIDCIATFKSSGAAASTYNGVAVYWSDDETCLIASGVSNSIKAGICVGVDSASQVKVLISPLA